MEGRTYGWSNVLVAVNASVSHYAHTGQNKQWHIESERFTDHQRVNKKLC